MKTIVKKQYYVVFLMATVALTLIMLELLVLMNLMNYTYAFVALGTAFFVSLLLAIYNLASEIDVKALVILLLVGIGGASFVALATWQLYKLVLFLWPDYQP